MDITIKHSGRKVEIIEQSNGIPICKLFCNNGIFLRTKTFSDMDQAVDFAIQWLHDMENNDSSKLVDILHRWEKSGLMAAN